MTISPKNLCAGILAGGLSRRMGGEEKSLMLLAGSSLIMHVFERIRKLEDAPNQTLINANGEASRFKSFDVPIIADAIEGFAGPLAGIHAMMKWLREHSPQTTHLASFAADTPFFPENYLLRMMHESNLSPDAIVLASSGGHRHPVFGIWPVVHFTALDHFLRKGETRKVMAFVSQFENNSVDFLVDKDETSKPDPFFNINTPEELLLAQKFLDT